MPDTKIEWATKTWNPLLGCERVSPSCDSCYAISQARIREANPHPRVAAAFDGLVAKTDHGLDWTGRINLLPERLTQPLHWRKPERIFVNSLSDLFHKDVPDGFIIDVFAIMALAPQHTFQLLTKRHARMRSILNDVCTCGSGHTPGTHLHSLMAWAVSKANPDRIAGVPNDAEERVTAAPWPLPNVHLGVSVENQTWADTRIPALLDTPAAVRWISAEPLLGPVRLSPAWIDIPANARPVEPHDLLGIGLPNRLDWVVTGGETGAKARPSHPDWFRSLRDQCAAAGVPYFFKQFGDWAEQNTLPSDLRRSAWDEKHVTYVHPKDGRTQGHGQWGMHDHLEGWAVMQRVGKKAAGRLLDGIEHNGYPTGARTS